MDKAEIVAEDIIRIKKYSRLSKEYVGSIVERFLEDFKELKKIIGEGDFRKNDDYKWFVKDVKSFLHNTYSVYQLKNVNLKEKVFSKLMKAKGENKIDLHKQMLHLHSSTRERKKYYEKVYENIFAICGKPKKILDVGCGLNAFSLIFSGLKNFEYVCCDFIEKDIELVGKYLKKLKGKAFVCDLYNNKDLNKVMGIKSDICFVFKMCEVLDYFEKGRKGTERFLKGVNANYVIFSFPTKTISRKRMNVPRRRWFELMIDRLDYDYDFFEIENECFYVVIKK
jgi:2-polyprenyl-3-methyl-5-hydroxy-6-metoxy-1,4-benzoquinol methylase